MASTRCSVPVTPCTTTPTTAADNNILYYNNYNNNISLSLSLSDYDLCAACLKSQIGYLPNDSTRRQLQQLLQQGTDARLICAVIEYTAQFAPRPSWYYAYKVLLAQISSGVATAEAFSAACDAHWRKRAFAHAQSYTPGYFTGKRQVLAQCFDQRSYDDDDTDDMSPEDIAAAKLL